MERYQLRKNIGQETVLEEVRTVLSRYGLGLGSGSGSTVPIERNGEKIGYVCYNNTMLTLDVTSPNGLDVKGLGTQLDGELKNKCFYETPKQLPEKLIPIEVVRNGKTTTLNETGLNIPQMVRFLYADHVQNL